MFKGRLGKLVGTLMRKTEKEQLIKLELKELTQEEKDKISDAFKLYDLNHDNHIDHQELEKVLAHFLGKPPTKTQLDNIFNKVDLNKDDIISYDEFETMMRTRKAQKVAYHKMFDRYDKNKDGFITREELLEALNKLDFQQIHEAQVTEQDVDDIIRLADLDKNEKIDYKEFLNFFV